MEESLRGYICLEVSFCGSRPLKGLETFFLKSVRVFFGVILFIEDGRIYFNTDRLVIFCDTF